jgi:predicted nucleotidyltransferase
MSEHAPLLRVCALLNAAEARYFIVGGYACILHGIIRTTKDVDLLVEPSEDNLRKVLAGLARMEDGWAKELTPKDLLENVVVKISDEVEVDVSTQAWKVRYADAQATAQEVEIEGVRIPFVGLETLIASKETYREIDQWDAAQLRQLAAQKKTGGN